MVNGCAAQGAGSFAANISNGYHLRCLLASKGNSTPLVRHHPGTAAGFLHPVPRLSSTWLCPAPEVDPQKLHRLDPWSAGFCMGLAGDGGQEEREDGVFVSCSFPALQRLSPSPWALQV